VGPLESKSMTLTVAIIMLDVSAETSRSSAALVYLEPKFPLEHLLASSARSARSILPTARR